LQGLLALLQALLSLPCSTAQQLRLLLLLSRSCRLLLLLLLL
jgi:hypothetical protein